MHILGLQFLSLTALFGKTDSNIWPEIVMIPGEKLTKAANFHKSRSRGNKPRTEAGVRCLLHAESGSGLTQGQGKCHGTSPNLTPAPGWDLQGNWQDGEPTVVIWSTDYHLECCKPWFRTSHSFIPSFLPSAEVPVLKWWGWVQGI